MASIEGTGFADGVEFCTLYLKLVLWIIEGKILMTTSRKKEIRKKLKDFLSSREDVVFAYVFGSLVDRKKFRDIDIAVYLDGVPDLINQGRLHSALDALVDPNVDLVLLNNLPEKNPAFAYEIMTTGELLINNNEDVHTDCKSKVFLYYFNTAYLRDQFQNAFRQRLKSQKFGERGYE